MSWVAWSVLMDFSIVILLVFHIYLFPISFPILLTFQSLLDFAVSVILLLKTLTVKDTLYSQLWSSWRNRMPPVEHRTLPLGTY